MPRYWKGVVVIVRGVSADEVDGGSGGWLVDEVDGGSEEARDGASSLDVFVAD